MATKSDTKFTVLYVSKIMYGDLLALTDALMDIFQTHGYNDALIKALTEYRKKSIAKFLEKDMNDLDSEEIRVTLCHNNDTHTIHNDINMCLAMLLRIWEDNRGDVHDMAWCWHFCFGQRVYITAPRKTQHNA